MAAFVRAVLQLPKLGFRSGKVVVEWLQERNEL